MNDTRGAGSARHAATPAGLSDLPPGVRAAMIAVTALLLATGEVMLLPDLFFAVLRRASLQDIAPALAECLFDGFVFGVLALTAGAGGWLGRRLGLAQVRFRAGTAPLAGAGAGFVAGVAGVTLALGLSGLAGRVHAGPGVAFAALPFAGGTLATLFQTAAEEFYFRGWLQPGLQRGWGRWPGLGTAALGFAGVHFAAAVQDPMAFPVLVLAGVLFGVLADRSGGLVLPVAAHFGWNWGEELLLGAAPNPGVGNFGALFDYDISGSALWGGSGEGLNTSLSSLVALTALIVLALLLPGRDGRGVTGSAARD